MKEEINIEIAIEAFVGNNGTVGDFKDKYRLTLDTNCSRSKISKELSNFIDKLRKKYQSNEEVIIN